MRGEREGWDKRLGGGGGGGCGGERLFISYIDVRGHKGY